MSLMFMLFALAQVSTQSGETEWQSAPEIKAEQSACPDGRASCDPWEKYRAKESQPQPWGNETPDYGWESEETTYWIYKSDISREGKNVTIWLNWKLKNPRPLGASKMLTRLTFDCAGRFRRSAETALTEDGSLYDQVDKLEDWTYIRPRSPYAVIANSLCSG
ncbi:surface-adhesin E family protein [Porphyrobacter sp. LM 6]|uniref:surface-adhesin E family protein n=1 Tax=Porphyrobacter sp. LM 6 TaxID=1896196 RepID=UPI0012375D60|nr:surface-adhesin E family protein [Porphyrobacter sp. LM 6]